MVRIISTTLLEHSIASTLDADGITYDGKEHSQPTIRSLKQIEAEAEAVDTDGLSIDSDPLL